MFTQDSKHKHTKYPPSTPPPHPTSHSSPTHGACPDLFPPQDTRQRPDSGFLKHKRNIWKKVGVGKQIAARPNYFFETQSQLSCSWCGERCQLCLKQSADVTYRTRAYILVDSQVVAPPSGSHFWNLWCKMLNSRRSGETMTHLFINSLHSWKHLTSCTSP